MTLGSQIYNLDALGQANNKKSVWEMIAARITIHFPSVSLLNLNLLCHLYLIIGCIMASAAEYLI